MAVQHPACCASLEVEDDKTGTACVCQVAMSFVDSDIIDIASGLGDFRT
jgi:hypothetical protein